MRSRPGAQHQSAECSIASCVVLAHTRGEQGFNVPPYLVCVCMLNGGTELNRYDAVYGGFGAGILAIPTIRLSLLRT